MSHIGYPRCEGKIPAYSHRKAAIIENRCRRKRKVGKFCKPCARRFGAK